MEWKVDIEDGTVYADDGNGRFSTICSLQPKPDRTERIANAHLIKAAVNACIKLNPDNPQAVAESIGDMHEALGAVVEMQSTPQNERVNAEQVWQSVIKALSKTEGK